MANKISPEIKAKILSEFSKPGSTKAGIAKKFNISASTVSRIVATHSEKPQEKSVKSPKPSQDNENGLIGLFREEGIADSDLKALLFSLKQRKEDSNMMELFDEFLKWVSSRDQMEKDRILASTEIDSMMSRKDSMEREIIELEGKTAKLEINVWKMKTAAEKAHNSMSEVQGRLEYLEQRMSENKDLLVLAAGLKSLIDSGELGKRVVSLIADPENTWDPANKESVRRISKALDRYIHMVSSGLSSPNKE